ncbi:MAG: oxygen-independent coproporphyrinogen III oxidase [Gammaproteobacteria bacterium]|nr:oxygen-independent coproporphyrinogen III oxidase [Gammaproteobacteria bacterium]
MGTRNADRVDFDEGLIRRYDGRGPRYTSYPTALQFSANLTAAEYRKNALDSNASDLPLSLYVHIPFCQTLCYYCGCNKIVTRNQVRVGRYLDDLYREIDMQSELFSTDRKVEQLHFGGGTPTYLSDEQLRALMDKLRGAFTFDDSDTHEFSIEVDPRSVTDKSIHSLAELGFNRLSLGIQDFNADVQKAVNRIQSVDEVQLLVETSRHTGFKSVSFDLIYGLPHQTVASFDTTLDSVIEMRPDRLAVYNYAHLPERFKGQRMINADDLPAPETKLDILHHTIDRLDSAGYVYIGMDHFALPEDDLVKARHDHTLHRNFQGYSTHQQCDLIGLGVSSISSIGPVYAQNAVSTIEYEKIIEGGQLPIARGIAVDADDALRAATIQSLMCYDAVSFDEFRAQYGFEFESYFAAELGRLEPLVVDGLVSVDTSGIMITAKGRLLLRSVAMVFDRYINDELHDQRYSKAI